MSFLQSVKKISVCNLRCYYGAVRGFASSKTRFDSSRRNQGKVALVTGGSVNDGIGMGIARGLAKTGCNIILTGSRGVEKSDELKAELESQYKVATHYVQADLSELKSIKKLHDDVKSLYSEGVDILVNNAGILTVESIEEFPLDVWERDLRVNLTAAFYLTKLTLGNMKDKGWGRIINISSILGLNGVSTLVAYVSTKHGMNGLTKVTALETLKTGVTCNSICPAGVDTELFRKLVVDSATEDGGITMPSLNPSGQYVKIEQIGQLAAFLCSPAADQMTGTTIPIDAGFCAQ